MICVQDVSTVYRVPLLLEDQGVVSYFCKRLNLPVETSPRRMLSKWKEMADRYENVSWLANLLNSCEECKTLTQDLTLLTAKQHSVSSLKHLASCMNCVRRCKKSEISQSLNRVYEFVSSFMYCKELITWCVSFHRSDRLLEHVTIALVGKYTKLADAYTSVIKALEHSALAINHKLEVKVRKYCTLMFLIPG